MEKAKPKLDIPTIAPHLSPDELAKRKEAELEEIKRYEEIERQRDGVYKEP